MLLLTCLGTSWYYMGWFGYELAVGTSCLGYDLVLGTTWQGTSWNGYELTGTHHNSIYAQLKQNKTA